MVLALPQPTVGWVLARTGTGTCGGIRALGGVRSPARLTGKRALAQAVRERVLRAFPGRSVNCLLAASRGLHASFVQFGQQRSHHSHCARLRALELVVKPVASLKHADSEQELPGAARVDRHARVGRCPERALAAASGRRRGRLHTAAGGMLVKALQTFQYALRGVSIQLRLPRLEPHLPAPFITASNARARPPRDTCSAAPAASAFCSVHNYFMHLHSVGCSVFRGPGRTFWNECSLIWRNGRPPFRRVACTRCCPLRRARTWSRTRPARVMRWPIALPPRRTAREGWTASRGALIGLWSGPAAARGPERPVSMEVTPRQVCTPPRNQRSVGRSRGVVDRKGW